MKMKHCFKFILYRWKQSLSTGEIDGKGFAFLLQLQQLQQQSLLFAEKEQKDSKLDTGRCL